MYMNIYIYIMLIMFVLLFITLGASRMRCPRTKSSGVSPVIVGWVTSMEEPTTNAPTKAMAVARTTLLRSAYPSKMDFGIRQTKRAINKTIRNVTRSTPVHKHLTMPVRVEHGTTNTLPCISLSLYLSFSLSIYMGSSAFCGGN